MEVTDTAVTSSINPDDPVTSLSSSGKIAYPISKLILHGDDNFLDWHLDTRQALMQGGYAYMLLAKQKQGMTPRHIAVWQTKSTKSHELTHKPRM